MSNPKNKDQLDLLDLPEEPDDSELDDIDKEIMEMGFIEDKDFEE